MKFPLGRESFVTTLLAFAVAGIDVAGEL